MELEPGKTVWGYSSSRDSDEWTGAYPTKEAAIEACRAELGEGWVISGSVPDPKKVMLGLSHDVTAEELLERMNEDDSSWDGEAYQLREGAVQELEFFLGLWAQQCIAVHSWCSDVHAQRVEPL